MFIYAPREVSLSKFYGNGGVEETTRFLARMERAWGFLHLDTEKEKISFFYEKIGEEVESEIDCHLEGKSPTSQQILAILRKCYGEKRTVPALRRVFYNIKQRKDETVRAFSHRLKDAFDAVINRQRDSGVDLCKMDELRDTFIENLRDRQTRRHLRDHLTSSPNSTFIEIRIQAERMEDDDGDSEGEEARASLRQVTSLSSEESSDYNEAVELLTKQVTKLTGLLIEQEHLRISQSRYDGDRPRPNAHRHNLRSSKGRNQRVTGSVCFRCGRQGHFARVCAQEPNSDFSVSPASRRGNDRRVTQGVTPRGQAHSMSIYTDFEGGSDRKVIGSRVTGTVKWFNVKRGFGLITHDGTREDIFAHHSSIVRNNPRKNLRSLGDGERVEFNVVKGRKGVMAIIETGPRGANVVGSRYAVNIDEMNPRHHANRLVDNRERRNKRCVGVEDYQSSDRPGGGSRNLCSGRRFLQRDQDYQYQPRQPRLGVSYDQLRECMARPDIGRRGDNHRERHATDVTQNQTSDSGSATTSCAAEGSTVTNHRGRDQHQHQRVTSSELRPLVGPSTLTHKRKDASLPVLPDEQLLPRRSRRSSRRPDRFGLY